MSTPDIRRYLANWQAEVDSTEQYLAMAAHEPDAGTARVYQNLAEIEKKHVEFWETRLRAAGHDPGPRKPSWRARVLVFCARRWGAKSVLETVASNEYESRNDLRSADRNRGHHHDQRRARPRPRAARHPVQDRPRRGQLRAHRKGPPAPGRQCPARGRAGFQRRTVVESQPGHGRGRRQRRHAHHPAHGHRRPAGRRVLDGHG
jgi:hypothetical protein